MKRLLCVPFMMLLVMLAGCGSSVRPMTKSDLADPKTAYLYGKFLNQAGSDIVITLENTNTGKEAAVALFESPQENYMVPVQPGVYRIKKIEFLSSPIGLMTIRDHYISGLFDVQAGKMYYFGDWNGLNINVSTGPIGSGPITYSMGRSLSYIDTMEDNFADTTKVIQEKYPSFGGMEKINLLDRMKKNYKPQVLAVKSGDEERTLKIFSMKRENDQNSLLVLKLNNADYFGGMIDQKTQKYMRLCAVSMDDTTLQKPLEDIRYDGAYAYFPNVKKGKYRLKSIFLPTSGYGSIKVIFDGQQSGTNSTFENYKQEWMDVYFHGVTTEFTVDKPGVYFLGGYDLKLESGGLLQEQVRIKKSADNSEDLKNIGAFLSANKLNWDMKNVRTVGNVFVFDEFVLR